LAYSGDTTGNGSLSSLDASRVQRVVVGLDSGFDAYDSTIQLFLATQRAMAPFRLLMPLASSSRWWVYR